VSREGKPVSGRRCECAPSDGGLAVATNSRASPRERRCWGRSYPHGNSYQTTAPVSLLSGVCSALGSCAGVAALSQPCSVGSAIGGMGIDKVEVTAGRRYLQPRFCMTSAASGSSISRWSGNHD